MTTPLSAQLKAAAADLHDKAESAGFTRQLFKGKRPIDDYASFLEQMLAIHEPLERALASSDHPAIEAIVATWQHKTPHLRADLIFLGHDPDDVLPLAETAAFTATFEGADPLVLLGTHYVLEGSMNGNHYMARAIRKAYGFEGADGTRYLDPYGDDQPARWAEFKAGLDAHPFSETERQRIVEADLETFRAIIEIHAALDRMTVPA